ncbi:hypothetical protein G8C92_25880 [Paenibacillus donghaensis]|uniref:hypothetical protein n=1 Tax=Paenibacillus donghaensis TaxID=414771 RepID=UPI0018848986|nr:hypothetical protein [Paenibacillus donghaensis]MBE9917447.1 hypothetical protein [Paenibacillus donghaensis]
MAFKEALTIAFTTAVLSFIATLLANKFKNWFDWIDNTNKFIRDHSYSQLKELYFELYARVAQSEYLRYHLNIKKDRDEVPFIEIHRQRLTLSMDPSVASETIDIKDPVTEFNKYSIAELIINKGALASQELLKLAVAYRFVHQYYTDHTIEKNRLEKFQTEELELIKKIVKCIVSETNQCLKDCSMKYSKKELKQGTMNNDIYNE